MSKKQIREIKANTAGRRQISYVLNSDLAKTKPVKSLTKGFKRSVGRDKLGHVTTRHKGGGAKRKYRIISTLNQCGQGPFKVERFEYDPNRSARIAYILNAAGKGFYILAPLETKIDHKLQSGEKTPVAPGNRLELGKIPTGVAVHSLELTPLGKAKIVRAAGTKATVMAHEGGMTLVKLPSGEIRRFNSTCQASVGAIGNESHNAITIGKAGRVRHMGIRPTVRGKAMHPGAHPHGGGEGGSSIGMKSPKTPWGKKALGKKTRLRRDVGNFIVSRSKKRK